MATPYAANLTNHDPQVYSTNASFVYSAKYTQAVLALLDPQPGERIVDLGCGTGELTRQIAEAVGPEGQVVGIDSSEAMVSSVQLLPATHIDRACSWSRLLLTSPKIGLSIFKPIFRLCTGPASHLTASNIPSTKSFRLQHCTGARPIQVERSKRSSGF